MAILAIIPASAFATPCPEMMQPAQWRLRLLRLDNAAISGPPEIARAATALRAGHLDKGMDLLARAGTVPMAEPIPSRFNRRYADAVMTAREALWELRGCPTDSEGNAIVEYNGDPALTELGPYQR